MMAMVAIIPSTTRITNNSSSVKPASFFFLTRFISSPHRLLFEQTAHRRVHAAVVGDENHSHHYPGDYDKRRLDHLHQSINILIHLLKQLHGIVLQRDPQA